mgnify:CR=1 FL=1
MGFFSDLKEDLSQAVNELIPDGGDETANEAADKYENKPVSLDEMLQNIDSVEIPEEEQDVTAEVPEQEELTEEAETDTAEEEAEEEDAQEDEAQEADAQESETFAAENTEEAKEEASDWDLEGLLENALTDEEAQPEEKTEENRGEGKTMEFNSNRQVADETSIITAGMSITGDIISEGSLDIIGNVNGNIDIMGKLNITGHITGNSKAAEIFAEGAKINGEIVSDGAVKIGASTVIVGNIVATSAAIAGAVKGDIDVQGPVVVDTSAVVMGNIKSRSVQINNGAVIEGFCSQCYADIDVESLFGENK